MPICRVCQAPGVEELYRAPNHKGFTSELKAIEALVRIGVCGRCGHCMTLDAPPGGTTRYYAQSYDLLTASDEEDDLFNVRADGTPIYRQEVELDNLDALLSLPKEGRILDYGCGKGAFLRRFLARHPGWTAHGFDMSERYRPFLERTIPPESFTVGSLGPLLRSDTRFDLIVMFQVAEHLEEPREVMEGLRGLLRADGTLYLTVPHLLSYSVDVFIADHLSHFTPQTLDLLLARSGFGRVLGSDLHQVGQITAAYRPEPDPAARQIEDLGPSFQRYMKDRVRREIELWRVFGERAKGFIAEHPQTAIYGAGAAGTFILSVCDEQRSKVMGYLDRNPFKIGKHHFGAPIYAPATAPKEMAGIIAALNPARAQRILEEAGLTGRSIPILYPG